MFDLIQVGKNTYYIDAPVKIGIFRSSEEEVYLIDSGNNKDAGRKLKKIIDEKGWKLKGIINTHSHADHIGGNNYLQKQTGCKIFAKGIEAAFTNYPILESSYLYGGLPPKALKNKFLLADESKCFEIEHPEFPKELEIISLHGHSFEMIGIKTPDDVYFIGDSISSKEVLQKYQITFLCDVKKHLDTLHSLKEAKAKIYIPSHEKTSENIEEIISINIDKIQSIGNDILKIANKEKTFEEILKLLFDEYDLTLNFEQYALVGSTLKSYLTWLKELEKIEVIFNDNYMFWKSL